MPSNLSNPAPIRQAMFDARGNLTRPWLLYFIGGGTTAQIVQTINEQISQSGVLSGFDDFNQRDFAPEIEAVSRQLSAVSPQRDFSQEIEEAKLGAPWFVQRDWTPEIEALAREIASLATPRNESVPDATGDSAPENALGIQQQLDELRVQLASVPTPAPPATVDASGALLAANNLSDLDDVATARTNLELGNATTQAIKTVTADYSVLATDYTVLADATAAALTITLPPAPDTGEIHNLKKIDSSANGVTFDGNGKQIEGYNSLLATDPGTSITIEYDGTAWRIE